jgi:Flp pilus assembly protein TadD
MRAFALSLVAAAMLSLAAMPAQAVDSGGSDETAAPTLAEARADIAAERWGAAIRKLGMIVSGDAGSADAYNLLGYAFRNAGNTVRAMEAYDRALALDPQHAGALEYQGELFVMLGETDKAKANLARIETICGTGCEEYIDLAEALAN